jgi:hypothetical protein
MEERRRSVYLQWITDGVKDDLEQIHQGLLTTSALWNEQPINEDSFVKTRYAPFFDAVFGSIPKSRTDW